jgi:hypothetical protein
MKAGALDAAAEAEPVEQREDRGRKRLADVRSGEWRSLDEAHLVPEKGETTGDRCSGRSAPDDAHVGADHAGMTDAGLAGSPK